MSDDENLTEQPSKAQAIRQDQSTLDLDAVLQTPQGRRVLLSILERCGLYRGAFTGEADATSFRLGEQNIGLWLIAQIEHVGPTEYPKLLLEAAQKKDKETVHVLDDME